MDNFLSLLGSSWHSHLFRASRNSAWLGSFKFNSCSKDTNDLITEVQDCSSQSVYRINSRRIRDKETEVCTTTSAWRPSCRGRNTPARKKIKIRFRHFFLLCLKKHLEGVKTTKDGASPGLGLEDPRRIVGRALKKGSGSAGPILSKIEWALLWGSGQAQRPKSIKLQWLTEGPQ